MDWISLVVKAIGYAIAIIILTEIAKRNAFISAVIIAFPLMTVLTMANLYMDTGEAARAYKLGFTTFWLILASTSFFGILYLMHKLQTGFWVSFTLAIGGAVITIFCLTLLLRRLGINLLSNV